MNVLYYPEALEKKYEQASQIKAVEIILRLIRRDDFTAEARELQGEFQKFNAVHSFTTYAEYLNYFAQYDWYNKKGLNTEEDVRYIKISRSILLEMEDYLDVSGDIQGAIEAYLLFKEIPENIFLFNELESNDDVVLVSIHKGASLTESQKFLELNWTDIRQQLNDVKTTKWTNTRIRKTKNFLRDQEVYQLYLNQKTPKEIVEALGDAVSYDEVLVRKIIKAEKDHRKRISEL